MKINGQHDGHMPQLMGMADDVEFARRPTLGPTEAVQDDTDNVGAQARNQRGIKLCHVIISMQNGAVHKRHNTHTCHAEEKGYTDGTVPYIIGTTATMAGLT